jgi:predicted transposase YdaD
MGETDHPLKRLVLDNKEDFAAWLLGDDVQIVQVTSVGGELTADPDPIDTDLLLLVTLKDGTQLLLHIEFQAPGSRKPMPLRMLDYLSRIVQGYRGIRIESVVIYLARAGRNDTGRHAIYGLDRDGQQVVRLAWNYTVLHLWRLDAEVLLQSPRTALLSLIGQTRLHQPEQTLAQAIARIKTETSGELQYRLLEELLLLCSNEEIAAMAERLIERNRLPETPMMRKLREEGRTIGREEGRSVGREEGLAEAALRLLTRRFGSLDATIQTQIGALSVEQLRLLTDALLDFTTPADVQQWLAQHLLNEIQRPQ